MAWTDKYIDLSETEAGDGSVETPWQTFAEALAEIGAIAAPTRIYVKGSGALGGNLNWNVAGAAATPITFVGCDASWNVIGDSATATKPTLACGAYTFDVSVAYITFENLAISSSHTTAGGTVDISGLNVTFKRCRLTATAANANACAIRSQGSYTTLIYCFCQATTTATYCVNIADSISIVHGNVVVGGVNGMQVNGIPSNITLNLIYGIGAGSGIVWVTSRGVCLNNTIVGHSGAANGITFSSGPLSCLIANNLIHGFSQAGSYPIALTNATASSACIIANNAWYNCANDTIYGVIETQATHAGPTLDFMNNVWNYGNTAPFDADPLPNAASLGDAADFDLAATHQGLAFPGVFEAGAYAYSGKMDHGALQHADPTSTDPGVGNVEAGVEYTINDVAKTGTFAVPAPEDVEATVQYGAGGTEFTGTLVAGGGGASPVFGDRTGGIR